jgi:hypothetical protein
MGEELAVLQSTDASESLVVAVVVDHRHAGVLGGGADQKVDRGTRRWSPSSASAI